MKKILKLYNSPKKVGIFKQFFPPCNDSQVAVKLPNKSQKHY